LRQAENGVFAAVVLKGCCLEVSDRGSKADTVLGVDAERCLRCGSCGVCVGIDAKPGAFPRFTAQCTRCGEGTELCMAACPSKAISAVPKPGLAKVEPPSETVAYGSAEGPANPSILPDSLRVAVCGVGGQGNLFFGKVLSQVVRTTAYFERNIVKGDVHGMAQKGGTVCSTFACGDVHSPLFASGSADILVAMERGELLRPEFLRLLKEDGTILLSDAAFPPPGLSTPYPSLESILEATKAFRTVLVKSGDTPLRNANAAMLGTLSVQAPFDAIGVGVWLDALRRLSPTPAISQGNTQAFEAGRQNALSHATAFATLDVPRRTP
jgi:indolepyruvate ferredoxin oxidoreductase alpha subunit